MVSLAAFAFGLLFALGLGISGMTQPARVTAFLDFTGNWNGSLAFVMAGAIFVYAIGYRLVLRRQKPLLEKTFHLPKDGKVDRRLLLGASLFGIGWGMAGFCPGPALVSLASFQPEPLVFVAALLFAMAIFEWRSREKA